MRIVHPTELTTGKQMMSSIKGVFFSSFQRNTALAHELLEMWVQDIYEKCSSDMSLFDGRTFRFIRTHPEELQLGLLHS